MTGRRVAAVSLRPEAEEVWDRIRAGFALHEGFWLAFVFGADSSEVSEFVARSRDLARIRVQHVDEIVLRGPGDVPAALGELVGAHVRGLHSTWLVGTTPVEPHATWVNVLHRLNERRDVLRDARPAAVVVCCPPDSLELVRDSAPDLWSFRSLTATVDRSAPTLAVPSAPDIPHGSIRLVPVPGDADEPSPPVRPLLRRAAGALRADRVDGAIAAARDALAAATGPVDEALAHAWLARTRDRQGEHLEARRHASIAFSFDRALGPEHTRALLEILSDSEDTEVARPAATILVSTDRDAASHSDASPSELQTLAQSLRKAGNIANHSGRISAAAELFGERLDLARRIHRAYPQSLDATRDLVDALIQMGEIDEAAGHVADAADAYTEALGLARGIPGPVDLPERWAETRRALGAVGRVELVHGRLDAALASHLEALDIARRIQKSAADDAPALRTTATALADVGHVQQALGDYPGALRSYRESRSLAMRIHAIAGDTAESLTDIAGVSGWIGDVLEAQGELDAALRSYTESMDLGRRVHALAGDGSPFTMQDLVWALHRIGDVQQAQGDRVAAYASYAEALELSRLVRARIGDVAGTLLDVSRSLARLGDAESGLGRPDTALALHMEGLDLARRVARITGDTHEILRDQSVALNKIGSLRYAEAGPAAALDHYRASVALARQVLTITGDTPSALRSLSRALDSVGNAEHEQGHLDEAIAAYAEALAADRQLAEAYGSSLDTLTDLTVSPVQLARVVEESGDRESALALYKEALEASCRLRDLFGRPHWDPDVADDLQAHVHRLGKEISS